MRAERMCGLARYVSTLAVSAAQTASTQWLERTLDDSVNRRLTLPHAFLACDGVLRLALNISNGLVANEEVIRRHVVEQLPYLATENLLMAGVAKGGDRQALHEKIRQHSHAATAQFKAGGPNDLLARLRGDAAFGSIDFDKVLDVSAFIGRAPQQVSEWLTGVVAPIRLRYPRDVGQQAEVSV
jgi:adenylosuccinate lyase